jgi:PAS domain S-box-containing protein
VEDVRGTVNSEVSSWYRALFAQSALGMTLADSNRRLIDCNDAFCRIVGRRRDDVLGRRFSEFNVPGDPDVGGPALEKVIAGAPAFSYEKRYRRADGTTTWVRINLAVLSRSENLYAGIVEDVSERRQAEAARELALAQLSEKTDLLARAHEVAKLGTFVIDSRARTMLVSAELARMLSAGEEPFEISVEQYRDTFVHPDDREWTMRLAESSYCHGEPARWERRLVRRDGEVIWETSHMLFELDEQGRAARVMGVVQDITDRVRLVEELRESRARIVDAGARERLRLERDLHDGAQNRLVAIQLKLARAREDAGTEAEATRLEEIMEDVEAAVEEVRAIGHGIYPRELRDGGPDHALRSLAESSPLAVRLSAEDVGRHAPTIEEAVYFCAREALQNAAKHAGAGAQLTLSLERREEGLEFEIADDGAGFDSREQSDGYGVASMRDRLAAVGGELAISSAPRQGTHVRGRVPDGATPTT